MENSSSKPKGKQPSKKRYEIHSTAYDKKGRVICCAANNYEKSNPWQKTLSIKAGMSEHRIKLHSEVLCILRSRGHKIHSMFIERYDTQGNPKIAFPCPSCQLAIKEAGVKIVRFTSEEGIKTWIV